MVGTVQKLTDEQAAVLKALHETNCTAINAFQTASKWIRENQRTLWDCIFEMYPELEAYECSYDWKNDQILVIRSKVKNDRKGFE